MAPVDNSTSSDTIAYIAIFSSILFLTFVLISLKLLSLGQKTRSPQQRRMYGASRARPSLSQAEPTIYVSPANLPPPPKYESMAPPSYEEVVGVHYPNLSPSYQVTQIQPITQPITAAMAQSTSNTTDNAVNNNVRNNDAPATVITVTSEQRRTSVTVQSS